MTSTNDGKDVKSNQTSGHKSKSYYIELYTSLEKALSGGGSLEERTAHVCEAWRRVYSLYQHSASSTHPHLLSWLQRHTANTVLQPKWAKSKNEQARLTDAIDALVAEATAAATGREQYPWEKLLLQRAAWFRKAVENPWDNPVLKSLINPNSEPVTDQQVLEWLISEHGIVLVTRLQRMVCAGNCDDLALLLASAVMDRARASLPHRTDDRADDRVDEEDPSSFVAVLERDASFTADEWEMLTDIELVLLLKTDKRLRCIELAKLTPLRHGYKMVERLRKRLETFPRDKKLWKHAKDVATIVAQSVITRCMVLSSCTGAGREALYWCARALARLVAGAALPGVCTKLLQHAAGARHLHTFTAALSTECKELKTDVTMKPFICELFFRTITTGMDELQQLKLDAEKASEARLYEQTLASWFTQLGERLTGSARLRAECALTAFSMHPARKHYERVASMPPPKLPQTEEPTPETQTTSEYGSWANDSRTKSNLVKTSETLQLKQSQQHKANVLSTAILTEGEALGLGTVLSQDLAVLLSGPRVKTLSWDMDREVLLENCRSYMEKTHGGTRAVTTELRFLNLDPNAYRHLPEEGDDETDLFYGIEKGYEHEVLLEEPQDIWQNAFFDPEQTESANDSEMDKEMKKKNKALSSEEDEDPLSNIAEAKREKKKLAKEKSKERRKKSHKRDDSKDGSKERRKDKDKKTKKERKKDKSEHSTIGSLTSLLGMKVTKISAQVQDGEKRVRKKKERRREPTTMFSYVSVTDSDYDSQGKSSQVSEHDPNVLVDGVFSMDEIRSPERTAEGQKAIINTNIIKNNATVQSPVINDIKTRPMSSPRVSTTSEDSDVSRARSPYLTPNQLGPKHVVSSKVKSSITKLLQYRKKSKLQVRDVPRPPPPTTPTHLLVGMKIYQPEEVPKVYLTKNQGKQLEVLAKDLPNEPSSSAANYRAPETDNLPNQNLYNTQKYLQQCSPHHIQNESQKHSEYTQHIPVRPLQQNISSQSPNSVHTNYSSPIKTPELMRTRPLNLTPPKPTMAYQPFHKSMQNLSTETKPDSPKKPQLINDPNYFTQQHVKSISSQLSPRIISNTCVKPPIQPPNVKQYSPSLNDNTKFSQTHSNLHGIYAPRTKTNSQMPESKNDVTRYGQKHLSISMQNISEPGRYDTKNNIQTHNTIHSQVTKSSVMSHSDPSTSQALYNSYSTASRCLPVQHRERVDKAPQKHNKRDDFEEYVKELMSKISAHSNGHDKDLTIDLNKNVKMTPVPSAKRVDSVTPQSAKQLIQQKKTENAPNTFSRRSYMHKNKQSENKVNLTDAISLELNRSILDQKITKSKCMKNEVTISRVGPKTHGQNIVRKLEQPCSRLQKDCPVLSSILDATGTPKTQTVGNASQNMSGNLANREDADLLLLLRNQSILKPNVSTIETLPSDVTSGQTSSNPQIKLEISSAHLGLVGTKVKNINILETTPVKRESEENKSLDWKCVMDALIAQKTEPLGPNALDLVLKKDYRRHSQSSRSHSSDKRQASGQTSHNKPSETKNRNNNTSKASSSRKPNTEKHSDTTKKSRELEIKNTTTQMLRPEDQKHYTQALPKSVSQTTLIPNTDYDILDDLLDDDLRREIGEISSDEETDNTPNVALPKGKTQSTIPKSVTNVYKAANIAKVKSHIVPKTIPKHETNTNIVDCNRRFTVTCPTGYPNVINNTSRPTHTENKPANPEIIRQHTATPTIITNQVAQDTANNIVTSIESNHFVSNVIPANVIIASVPQSPVVVIRQDLVYDPYPTIRIHESQLNTELCSINQRMYALNPNFALYQTTQYAAPVINPVIIGNAMTTTNVAMGNDHASPGCMKDKQDEDSISLEEAIRLTDDRNDIPVISSKRLENVIRLSEDRSQKPEMSTNLDFNMNRNCERKVLSQVQEKHPNDVDKDLKKSPVVSPLKVDEDRIKLKRQYLMNRKISHAKYPPIPLTYTPLTKKVNIEKQLQQETAKNGIVKSNLKSIPDSDIEKCVVISTCVKSPQSETNNENIESTDQVSSAKENQKTCRRIWLRSSNKILNKLSPVKRSRVPLRRDKIKLKESEVIEKAANLESENKDGVKNRTRVSNRILNKVKLIKPATNETPTQEERQQNVAENHELIDFEAALCSSIVLKTPTELGTANTSKQEPKYFNIMAEQKLANAEFSAEHKHINSTEDTKGTSQLNRLEPTVVIEKLKGNGDQLIIRSSSIETRVKEAKAIVIKNKNRTVLRKRIIQKCISTKEFTPNKIIIKAAKNTVSLAIGSSVANKANKLKPVVILDQKVIKAPPIGSPLVRVETNKLVEQKVINNNESKPGADNEIVADQKVIKQTTTVSSQPVILDQKMIKTPPIGSPLVRVKTNKLVEHKVTEQISSAVDDNNESKPVADNEIVADQKVNKQTTTVSSHPDSDIEPALILDQKMVKTPPIGSPLVRVKTNKLVEHKVTEQILSAVDDNNRSKPVANNEIVADQKVNKQTTTVSSQPLILDQKMVKTPPIGSPLVRVKTNKLIAQEVIEQISSAYDDNNESKPVADSEIVADQKVTKQTTTVSSQPVILDQKMIKTPPIGSPLVRVKTNKLIEQKVIEQISSAYDDNNESKPVADNEIVADQKVTKQTTTVSSQPMFEVNNEVNPTVVSEKTEIKLACSRLDIEKGKILNSTVDKDKIIKQITNIDVSLDKNNKSTTVDDNEQTFAEKLPRDFDESNKSKSRDDQRVIKLPGSTSDSSTTVHKKHDNDSPDCTVSSEIEVKNNQPQTLTTALPLENEKTCPTKEIPSNSVMQKQEKTIIQSKRSVIMSNSENSTKINAAEDSKLNEANCKPTQKQSPLISDTVNVNHSPVTQKNSDDNIDISDVLTAIKILKPSSKNSITNKDQQIRAGKSLLCQENMDKIVKEDAALDIRQDKQDGQQILNIIDTTGKEKQTYMKGDIKIQELPVVNNKDPYMKLVRITVPNGKVFRASIHGKVEGDFDSLFSDPAMRSILAGSTNDGKRYTVNYRQVSKTNRSNPSKILGTQIQDLDIQEAAPIDTVNLISDDEDEVPTLPSRSFTTEFGKYTTNLDEKTFTLHQRRFNQKCEIKMLREDIFKSNKTKPKSNFPSERSSLLTRNKSKRLANANAPVEASTTANIIPEIVYKTEVVTHVQETRIPIQTNSTLKDDTTNIIEIDDSSNDSIGNATPTVDGINLEPVKKLDELKGLLLHDLGVGIDTNVTFPRPKEKAVGNLKSALLQDLGIATTEDSVIDITADDDKKNEISAHSQKQIEECLENHPLDFIKQNEDNKVQISTGIQIQNPVDDTVQNDDKKTLNNSPEQDRLQKCVVRLVKCDKLIKKYEYIKTMKKCYIKLERLNDSILKATLPSSNENINKEAKYKTEVMNNEETDEMNQDSGEDFIEFDDEPSSSPRLSRCPSLSILNNWDDDSQPVGIAYPSSPVMEIYDTIVQLRNKLITELVKEPEKVMSLSCDSEWTVTKFGYRVQEIQSRSDIPAPVNTVVPDCDNLMVSGVEKLILTFNPPKLLTIVLKFLEENPDVIYRLETLRSLRRIRTKTARNKLKRKTEELVSESVASKILKLGTLALNSLNSCIKVLDVIRFPNIEENMKVQLDTSNINIENHVIVESPPKVDTIIENTEGNTQIDDFMTTSYIENSDLVAECDEDINQTIHDAFVNEDTSSPLEETMLICPVIDNERLSNKIEDHYKEETLDTHSNQQEKNKIDFYAQCENDKGYSSPTKNVAHVPEDTSTSEDTMPIIDSDSSPTDDKAEKCKEQTQDGNQCDTIIECSSPAIKVSHVPEETNSSEDTMPVTDSDTSLTDDRAEKLMEETQNGNQCDNIKEYSSPTIDVANAPEEKNSSEDIMQITDSETTDCKAEKCKEETQDGNQSDNVKKYLSPTITVTHIPEETNSSEATTQITNFDTTDDKAEKFNEESQDGNQCDNIKEYSSPSINIAHVPEQTNSSEATIEITNFDTTDDKAEKYSEETQDGNQYDNIKEYSSPSIHIAHVPEQTNSSEDTMPITDYDTSLTDDRAEKRKEETQNGNQCDNIKEYSNTTIKVAHVHEETHSSEDTVPIGDPNTSPTNDKAKKCQEVSQASKSKPENCKTDLRALFEEEEDYKKCLMPAISIPLASEDTKACSEDNVQIADTDICPTDNKTQEEKPIQYDDDIAMEQSAPARCEVDLLTDECEQIKIDENTSTAVNDNLFDETSNTCGPSETNSCDVLFTEDNLEVELPSQLGIEGDRESKTSANVSNEEGTDEISHIVNIDRLDEIPIDEIHHNVCEVEVVNTHIEDGLEIDETLYEKSHESVSVSVDSSDINHLDSAIVSPVFIDSKKIAFNYHDYTKQPKNKDASLRSVICGEEREINNDEYVLPIECASETGPSCEETPKIYSEVNASENCPLKSSPECKYELFQEDDLLTVKITTEKDKDDNDSKTVFVRANDAEDESVASICSDLADDIDIKGFEFEDIYVFPLNQSAGNSNNTSNDSVGQESNSKNVNETVQDDLQDNDFHVIEPKITYSRKRKVGMWDIRVPAKKYRKGKNIDCSKQTANSMAELAYGKEYKRLLEYCSSVKFSYTRPFHKECIEIDDLMSNWPIKNVNCDVPGDIVEAHLFVDLQEISSYQPDPMEQTFIEEINYEYETTDTTLGKPSSEANEVNFNMGFGEGSGRVIQILKKGESNISAATLSDVKQSQPVLKSVDLDDCNDVTTSKDEQIKKIRQHFNFIELRDKVRTFFKKTSVELKSDWLQNTKDPYFESKCYDRCSAEEFPFDLCSLDYLKPVPTNVIVQVVQVGQLPVSAAAQNPVTCDPRVTQVSDASPSQCSVDNSPNEDSQSEIKTEYTELTTADLSLPLQEYAQQNQANLASNDSNVELTEQTISLEMEIKAEESPVIKEEMPDIKEEKSNSSDADLHTLTNATPENMNYSFENNTAKSDARSAGYDSSEQNSSETFSQQRQQNGTTEKTDQIAHAMNAAGITTTPETVTNTRAHALVNILSQKIRQGSVNTTQTTTNTYSKTTSINAMALQQALAQILPPPLNQTGSSENNQSQTTPVGPQVLHIVQGKNASGNQITLVDNSQQSVINTSNATQVLHIVQNKNATPGQASNGTLTPQTNSFSGLSLVDAGLQQGGNQLLHIVNTGNQKTASPGQLLKRVNLLTNLANVQGSNEQKMVQFVCKSADGKAIQLNAPHQRSMVLRLQPIETPNVQTPAAKPAESQEPSPSPTCSASSKESASQQEIKSRSIYEENYAKFIQNSSSKTPGLEKSTSLPKFNQAFGKPVFQDGQKQSETANNNTHLPAVNTNNENAECPATDNAINLEHIGQISSPPLLLRKQTVVTSASQPNIVQQIKQTIAPMNIQTMHGGVIYTRQIPVNIGGGQTINLITVPSTELINDDSSKTQAQSNQGEIEPSIIKIVPQSQTTTSTESTQEESNNHASGSNENVQTPQPQPVLTQMRIKLPMLSKAPQMVPGARVVRPSFFQIQRNVIGGANQPVYQQLVLTAAPPLGQQTIRLPQAQASRPVSKASSESQSSSSESQMSTSTLEQLREFDMVLEQVKERSTVQPSTNSNNSSFKIHTTSSDTTDGNGSSNCSTESTPQVLYSIGNNQSLNVTYVNRNTNVTTPTTSTYVRSPDSSGMADSPTSSTHVQIPHTVTTDSSPTEMSSQSKQAKVGSKSKSRPKSTSNPPNTLKLNSVPPKTSSQKPLEDEQTTQRILYILAEYKEQVENSPDKDKPAPRRRSNPPSNPGSSKRKKSSSSRRSGTRDMSPIHGEDTCRTMGSEDSSCGTSQGDCTESCLDSHSPQDSPRKVARKITFDQDITVTQPRPQPQRNVIVADGQTITVARGTTGKPATAVLMPANYILPVSMVKGGQQIAIVTNRGPKLLTVGGEGGATNALLLQRLIGPAGLKPVLARPGVRHVRLPTAALHNLQAFNLATATTVQPPDSTASPTPGPTPPELVDTRATSSPWTDREDVKPERGSSPEGSEPWNLPSSADAHDYTYEETVRTDNMDRTVLDPIPDRYSPDMEAQRIFDKMFDVDSKKSYAVDSHDDSPRCAYDIDPSDCDDKAYQVVQKKDGSQRQHRLSHVSAAALRHKYAILEHELRLQKSLSEECEDLGVDSPSASELFPEAELLFAASPAHEHNQEHHSHTPQPHQSSIPQPDMDDQIATDHLIPREIDMSGLGDVGIVAVSEDGSATIALDQEEFARSHPNTTFHSEPTEGEVQPFTITGLKGRHITSTIFHSNSAPATVLMTAPQATVISQAPDHSVKYEIENMINSMPSSHNNDMNLSSVLVKDDGLTRFDNILTDSRELHLTNTTSAIVHSSGNATQVIRRVCYEDDKRERDARYLIDEPDNLIAGDDAKMIAEDSSRDATLESMADVDDDRSSPERHAELFWESNSASERSESRRPLDFSSDSDKCCKSPFDETNSTDSSGVGTHMRLDSVIKEARGRERSGSAEGSSADDGHPPLRTYPPKRMYHPLEGVERSLSGKTRAGESPDLEVRRRASGRGVVKRGCHCCNGSPAPPKKKPRQRKPTLDFNATN